MRAFRWTVSQQVTERWQLWQAGAVAKQIGQPEAVMDGVVAL